MSEKETMGELFERGLALRREVPGAGCAGGSMNSAGEFMSAGRRLAARR
ncbi:MAG: hypothetical protein IT514_12425 [Burkholderiales bacterium]|nr:hypothetical protein [Burkholderiales bacterium]